VQKGVRSSRDVCCRSVFTSADNVCESEFRTASDERARPGNEASTGYPSISVSILGISVVSNCSNYASDFTSYTTQTFPGKNYVYYYITLEKYIVWQRSA